MNLTEPLPFRQGAPPELADTAAKGVEAGIVAPENAALLSNRI